MEFNKPIIKTEMLAKDIYLIRIQSDEIVAEAQPGQFVNVKCSIGMDAYLRRPISICRVNRKEKTFDLVYMNRGKGTGLLCGFCEGDVLDVMGPLGKGFTLPKQGEKVAVVGGGIGVFPLLFLLQSCVNVDKTAFVGFRSREAIVLERDFRKETGHMVISTDDGSCGFSGLVTVPFTDWLNSERPDRVYACGPMPMMKNVAENCIAKGIFCEVSVEQRMGCGIGACLVCACEVKDGESFDYAHVCKDGPVFPAQRLVF